MNLTYEDNFPTTNLEALACGTPVITYQTGGSPEAIDATSGVVVPVGDVNALAESIRSVCQDPKKSYDSEVCRKRVEQSFRKEDRYQEYFDLYSSLLKR